MTEVTISLVSYNQCNHLRKLLPSLTSAAELVDAEIMLVDNRSDDDTSNYVHNHYPEIRVTYNPYRAGYGENHNLNLHNAHSRYFVIMNSDMTVEIDVFRALKQYMETNPDIGIISPKVFNSDGTIQGLNKRYPTLIDLFLRRFIPRPLKGYFQRRLDYYEMRNIGYDRIYDVEFLSGAFMFCRTDLLKSVGGFDSRYFLYFEDADLCRRVQKTHRTVYYPYVSVTHFWERSAHKNLAYTYHFIKSAYRYFSRWRYRLF
jgi:GT2 family glycosyltransferase